MYTFGPMIAKNSRSGRLLGGAPITVTTLDGVTLTTVPAPLVTNHEGYLPTFTADTDQRVILARPRGGDPLPLYAHEGLQDAAEAADTINTGRLSEDALQSTIDTRTTVEGGYVRNFFDARYSPKVGTSLGADSNLNSLAPGVYYQNSNVNATPEKNYPAAIAGTLIQHSWGNGMTQVYYPYTANLTLGRRMYTRSRASGAWQPWIEYLSTPLADERYARKGEVPPGGISEEDADARYVHQATGTLADELLPVATPAAPSLTFETKPQGFDPRARGVDGYVYFKFNQTRMVRSNDGLATYEIATHEWTGKDIYWISRIREGYVALIKGTTAGVNEIWRTEGDDWNTGWEMVQEVGHLGVLSFPQPVIGRDGSTVLVVPEYTASSPGMAMKVWLSTDGGATWRVIRESQVVDPQVNTHWHGAIFDPARDRIWVAQGDGPNSWFGYTDDYGNTWIGCPMPENHPLNDGIAMQQPTVLLNFGDYIALSPDRGPFAPGMWQADADNGLTVPRAAVPGLEELPAHAQFGIGGVRAQRGKEAYVAFPDTGSGNRTTYVLGTGDAGRTWHLVYTYPWGATGTASGGIAGPDASGHLYFRPSNTGCQVAKALTWQHSTARTAAE